MTKGVYFPPVLCRNVEKYAGKASKDFQPGGRFFNQKSDVKAAVEKAESAVALSVKERLGLVVCIASEDEEEEDEEEEMDVQSKLFE